MMETSQEVEFKKVPSRSGETGRGKPKEKYNRSEKGITARWRRSELANGIKKGRREKKDECEGSLGALLPYQTH